jgi:hypothetical protein
MTELQDGWIDFDEKIILNKSTPGIYSFYVKVAKIGETNFEVTIGLRKGHDLLGK